jgi:hypothetical protein
MILFTLHIKFNFYKYRDAEKNDAFSPEILKDLKEYEIKFITKGNFEIDTFCGES